MLTDLAVKELQKLAKKFRTEATPRFNMFYFGESTNCNEGLLIPGQLIPAPCNTQACIAGELALSLGLVELSPNGGFCLRTDPQRGEVTSIVGYEVYYLVKTELGLSEQEQGRLFFFASWQSTICQGWPLRFELAYAEATTIEARCLVAAERIEHFIQTGGAE